MYKPDEFYEVKKEQQEELLYEAKELAEKTVWDATDWLNKRGVSIDELTVRPRRECNDKSFDEVWDIYKNSGFQHYVFIRRNSSTFNPNIKDYLEIGIRTNERSTDKDYFIFINLDVEHEEYFINKYKLERL